MTQRSVWQDDPERLKRVSIIQEGYESQVRMAHLAIVGSHSVNGVSKLHSELVKTRLVPDFYQLWPERFSNKTNGVTQRRWLLMANPGLASLLDETIGAGWTTDLDAVARGREIRRRRRVSTPLHRDQARQQGAPGANRESARRRRRRSRRDVRHPGQAYPRIQAPTPDGVGDRASSTCGWSKTASSRRYRARTSSRAKRRPATGRRK